VNKKMFRLLSRDEFTGLSVIGKCDYLASVTTAPESNLQLFQDAESADLAAARAQQTRL